jgi:hypothetical protein
VFKVNGLLFSTMKELNEPRVDGGKGRTCRLEIGISDPVYSILRYADLVVTLSERDPVVGGLRICQQRHNDKQKNGPPAPHDQ